MQPPAPSYGIFLDPAAHAASSTVASTAALPADHKQHATRAPPRASPRSKAGSARGTPRSGGGSTAHAHAHAGASKLQHGGGSGGMPPRHLSGSHGSQFVGEYVVSTGHLAHPAQHRTRASSLDFAEAGHGGGGTPGSGGGGGGVGGGKGGGKGGDAHGEGHGGNRLINPLASIALGIRARLVADPDFLYKLAVECMLDTAIILIVNWVARGKRFVSEFEFVLCQIAVSLLNDFALVYLLAPVAPLKGVWSANKSPWQQMLERLPAHVLQRTPAGRRPYTLRQRAACFGVKAVQYGTVGFCMGVLGTSLVHGLTELRERMDPSFTPPATMQSIVGTGAGWLYFMAFSSNVRYNLVNACEEYMYTRYPGALSKLASVGLRLVNNFVGAANWIQVAHMMKLSVPHVPYQLRRQG